ncbi:MAG TPA: hypothetical protein ENG05_02770 [Acidilobales archaeon]|nr:hypothetical protein [Acidilobales archaeon]
MSKWWERPLRILQFNIEDRYGTYLGSLNSRKIIDLALKVGANVLVVFARDPWGRVFYEGSRIGPKHPKVKGDFIKELVNEGSKRGVRVVVMVGHTANKYVYEKHSDWAQVNVRGEVVLLEHVPYAENAYTPEWPQICINSPYYEMIKEEVKEVLKLKVGGVFLDSFRYQPDIERACYCKWCQVRFKKELGYDMPAKPEWSDSRWRSLWKWRYKVVVEKIKELYKLVKSSNDEVMFMYNSHPGGWAGRTNKVVEEGRDFMDFIFAECSEADHQPPGFIAEMVKLTKAMAKGKPVAASRNYFHMYRTVEASTSLAIRQGLRESMIAGGNLWLLMFSSTYVQSPYIIDEVSKVFKEHEKLEEFLVGAEGLKHVGIVVSNSTRDFYGRDEPHHYVDEVRGFYYALTHEHIPVNFIAERDLSDSDYLSRYRVIVLANSVCLSDDALEGLRRYVGSGGKLIATFLSSTADEECTFRGDFGLHDIMGVKLKGISKSSWSYVVKVKEHPIFENVKESMFLCGDMSYEFTYSRTAPFLGWHALVDAQGDVVAIIGEANDEWGYEYTLGRSPPMFSHKTDSPAIVLNDAKSMYFTFQLGRHYWRLGLPLYRRIIANAVYHLSGHPDVIVDAPETVISEVHRQKGDRVIVHLLNTTYNQRILAIGIGKTKQPLPPYSSNEAVHSVRTVIPIQGITIKVRLRNLTHDGKYNVFLPLSNRKLNYELSKEFLTTRLDVLKEYEVVVIESRR